MDSLSKSSVTYLIVAEATMLCSDAAAAEAASEPPSAVPAAISEFVDRYFAGNMDHSAEVEFKYSRGTRQGHLRRAVIESFKTFKTGDVMICREGDHNRTYHLRLITSFRIVKAAMKDLRALG